MTEGERRPIASRERAVSKAVAGWLARRGASPNAISLAGMLSGIAAGAALWLTGADPARERWWWLGAAVLVQGRLAANMLDGMVAVSTGKASPVGELFNEIPDRVSDAAIFVGLGHAAGGSPALGWALALAAVFTAYVRAAGKVAGAGQDYSGPFAKPQRMFAVTVLAVYMGLAPGDLRAGVARWGLLVLLAGTLLTAARRLHRIARTLRP